MIRIINQVSSSALVLLLLLSTLLLASSFSSATTYNGCANNNNKLEILNFNAPTTPLRFENIDNCDIIIKSSQASSIIFQTVSGSGLTSSNNVSITIHDFVCASPTEVQTCISFATELLDVRNISINNIQQNLEMSGRTSIVSAVRFYLPVRFGNYSTSTNNNNNTGLFISNVLLSGTIKRGSDLLVHAVHFDDGDVIISDARTIVFNNIRISDFAEIYSTGGAVEVFGIVFAQRGRITNFEKCIFRDIFVRNINKIRSDTDGVSVGAISSAVRAIQGNFNCRNNNNLDINNINIIDDEFLFSSSSSSTSPFSCGLVVHNIIVSDLPMIETGSATEGISVISANFANDAFDDLQLLSFTNFFSHRITVAQTANAMQNQPDVSVDLLRINGGAVGTDLDKNAAIPSIMRFSNFSLSDRIEISPRSKYVVGRRPFQQVNSRAIVLISGPHNAATNGGRRTIESFNQIEFSNILISDVTVLTPSKCLFVVRGVAIEKTTFNGCANLLTDSSNSNNDDNCFFSVTNVTVSNIKYENVAAVEIPDLKAVEVLLSSVVSFQHQQYTSVFIRNINPASVLTAVSIEQTALENSLSGANLDNTRLVVSDIIVDNVLLVYVAGRLDELKLVAFHHSRRCQSFATISFSNIFVSNIGYYLSEKKDLTVRGVEISTISYINDMPSSSSTSFSINNIHLYNISRSETFRRPNNNNPWPVLLVEDFLLQTVNIDTGGEIHGFKTMTFSNISLDKVSAGNSINRGYRDAVFCALDLAGPRDQPTTGRIAAPQARAPAFTKQSQLLIENIFVRDVFAEFDLNGITGRYRRVNAFYTRYSFSNFYNFTLQNLGIVGDIRILFNEVRADFHVASFDPTTGNTYGISAHYEAASAPQRSSLIFRNICMSPSRELNCPDSPSSFLTSSSSNNNDNKKISFEAVEVGVATVFIGNSILNYQHHLMENLNIEHLQMIRSPHGDSRLDVTFRLDLLLWSVDDVVVLSGRDADSEKASSSNSNYYSLTTFVARNLILTNIEITSTEIAAIQCFGVIGGSRFDDVNKISFENFAIDNMKLIATRKNRDQRIALVYLDITTISGRDIPEDNNNNAHLTEDIFNSVSFRNFSLINSNFCSEAGPLSAFVHALQGDLVAGGFDQILFQNTRVENVSIVSLHSVKATSFTTTLIEGGITLRNEINGEVYNRMPSSSNFIPKVEFCSSTVKNFVITAPIIECANLALKGGNNVNLVEIVLFNASHFYNKNVTLNSTHRAFFIAGIQSQIPSIRGPLVAPPSPQYQTLFTINNIHSENIHVASDSSTTNGGEDNTVQIVNGLTIEGTNQFSISNFDLMKIDNLTLVKSTCHQSGYTPSPIPAILNDYSSKVYFFFFYRPRGTMTVDSILFSNFLIEDVEVSSVMEDARIVAVYTSSTSTQTAFRNLNLMLVENITIQRCSAVASVFQQFGDAIIAAFQTIVIEISSRATTRDTLFRINNININNLFASASDSTKIAGLVSEQRPDPFSGFHHYSVTNINLDNNTLKNSDEGSTGPFSQPTAPMPHEFSSVYLHLFSAEFGSITGSQQFGSSSFTILNISQQGNDLSFAGSAYAIVFRVENLERFHTVIFENVVIRDMRIEIFSYDVSFEGFSAQEITNEDHNEEESRVTSTFKINSILFENVTFVSGKLPASSSSSSEDPPFLSATFSPVKLDSISNIAHFSVTNIFVNHFFSSLTDTDLRVVSISSRVGSPLAEAERNTVGYYNNSFKVENITVQDCHSRPTPDNNNNNDNNHQKETLLGKLSIQLFTMNRGYDDPPNSEHGDGYCHTTFKNLLLQNSSSSSSSNGNNNAPPHDGFGNFDYRLVELYLGFSAPNHPTQPIIVTSATTTTSPVTKEEKREKMLMASCSFVASNLTLDSAQGSVRDVPDNNSMRRIQSVVGLRTKRGGIYNFASVSISDLVFSNINVRTLSGVRNSDAPSSFYVYLVCFDEGIKVSQGDDDSAIVPSDFIVVPVNQRKLQIQNFKIQNLVIGQNESRDYSAQVYALTLGEDYQDASVIRGFHSVIISDFTASNIDIKAAQKFNPATTTTKTADFLINEYYVCGLIMLFIRGPIIYTTSSSSASSSSSSSTKSLILMEKFQFSRSISVSSTDSAYLLGVASFLNTEELINKESLTIGFQNVTVRDFTTNNNKDNNNNNINVINISSRDRTAIFSQFFLRGGKLHGGAASSSSPATASLSFSDFTVGRRGTISTTSSSSSSSSSSISGNTGNSKINLISIEGKGTTNNNNNNAADYFVISGFDNVSFTNIHLSPASAVALASMTSSSTLSSARSDISAIEIINGTIHMSSSSSLLPQPHRLEIHDISITPSQLNVSAHQVNLDTLRIGGWRGANNQEEVIRIDNIALNISSTSSISSSSSLDLSAITISTDDHGGGGMIARQSIFSSIHTSDWRSSATDDDNNLMTRRRISTINFQHSPSSSLWSTTISNGQFETLIQNCSLRTTSSTQSSLLSFASPSSQISGNWSLVGNTLITLSSGNASSIISFETSSPSLISKEQPPRFSFLENNIVALRATTSSPSSFPQIVRFLRDSSASSSSSSPVDFYNAEFDIKCNYWNRAYENRMTDDIAAANEMVTHFTIKNIHVKHSCRTKSSSMTLLATPSKSPSLESTPTHHRTSLSTSLSLPPSISSSGNITQSTSISESVSLPLPPPPLVSAFVNSATKTAGTIISMFAGANGAMTTRKILAISSTADCGKRDISADAEEVPEVGPEENPLSLRIGGGGRGSKLSGLRGVVIGGFCILVIWCIVMFGFALIRKQIEPNRQSKPNTFSRALYKVGMPGSLWVPAASLFPVSVNSCVVIAIRYSGDVVDIVMMILGFCVCGIATVWFLVWIMNGVKKHEVLLPEGLAEKDIEAYLNSMEHKNDNDFNNMNEQEVALMQKFRDDTNNKNNKKKQNNNNNNNNNNNTTTNLLQQLRKNSSGEKQQEEEEDSKSLVDEGNNNKKSKNLSTTTFLVVKARILFDYLTQPVRLYAKTKFVQRFETLFNWTAFLWFIPISYISVLIMEIIEANTSLCAKGDRSCCEGGIIAMTVFAFLDLVLIVAMRSPFLVRIDRLCLPIITLFSFISSVLITVQFFDSTSHLSEDGEDLRPQSDRLNLVDALVTLSQFAFILSMINCTFNAAAEFLNSYMALKEVSEKKEKRELSERRRRSELKEKEKEKEKKRRQKKKKEEQEKQQQQQQKKSQTRTSRRSAGAIAMNNDNNDDDESEMKILKLKKPMNKRDETVRKTKRASSSVPPPAKGASRKYMSLLDEGDDFNEEYVNDVQQEQREQLAMKQPVFSASATLVMSSDAFSPRALDDDRSRNLILNNTTSAQAAVSSSPLFSAEQQKPKPKRGKRVVKRKSQTVIESQIN